MSENPRARKVADRIKVIVAECIERRIKDPRLGFCTITDVRVTGDLQHATVFYTVLGSEEERSGTAAALDSAKGVIRREVGQGVGIRLTPSLEFIADAMPENAAHIDDLLLKAAALDADVAAQASKRVFAGDADPYRKRESDSSADGVDDGGDPADGVTPAGGAGGT